jgi:hypothetical protein
VPVELLLDPLPLVLEPAELPEVLLEPALLPLVLLEPEEVPKRPELPLLEGVALDPDDPLLLPRMLAPPPAPVESTS